MSSGRIAKNTISLSLRMVLTAIVGLYSTRLLLSGLGTIDYGIFSVVGGVVTFLAFFNSAMSSSIQRHLSFEMARGDVASVSTIYNASLRLSLYVAGAVFLLSETVGLLFVENVLRIPDARMQAARVVYQCVIVMVLCNIVNVTPQALINAKEDMHVIATRGVIESFLRLAVAFVLLWVPKALRLESYALLSMTLTILVSASFFMFCKSHYAEAKFFRGKLPKELVKELLSFASWTMFGTMGAICRNQGTAILLNMFFGPAINASYGIATQIGTQLQALADTVNKPFAPQLVGEYSKGNLGRVRQLVSQSSRFATYLVLIVAAPLFFKTEFVLGFWLGKYPVEAVPIVRLILLNFYLAALTSPLILVMQATGKIGRYQAIVGSSFILSVPISYVILKMGYSFHTAFYTLITATVFTNIVKVAFAGRAMEMPASKWITEVALRPAVSISLLASLYFVLSGVRTWAPTRATEAMELLLYGIFSFMLALFVGTLPSERNRLMNFVKRGKSRKPKSSATATEGNASSGAEAQDQHSK